MAARCVKNNQTGQSQSTFMVISYCLPFRSIFKFIYCNTVIYTTRVIPAHYFLTFGAVAIGEVRDTSVPSSESTDMSHAATPSHGHTSINHITNEHTPNNLNTHRYHFTLTHTLARMRTRTRTHASIIFVTLRSIYCIQEIVFSSTTWEVLKCPHINQ
jgi:hypothetical protein